MEHYEAVLTSFVREKLPGFYEGLKEFYSARGKGDPDSLSYFRNHMPRFEEMISIVMENVSPDRLNKICELGSFYPYTTYFFKWLREETEIDIYDIILRELSGKTEPYDIDGVRFIDINFCTEPLPKQQYDLIILSEVIEHLPINIYAFTEEVEKMLSPNGYLVVTYPTRGKNAKDYEKEYRDRDWERLQEDHIREFTAETVGLFFQRLTLLERRSIRYRAMGRCEVCLYQRSQQVPT